MIAGRGALAICILLAGVARAAAAAGDAYAYAFVLRSDGESAAWQVELNPDVYAVAAVDLHDVGVVDADGNAAPAALYRPPAAGAVDALVDLPLFAVPQPEPGAQPGSDAIRLQIERGADGRLRRVAADVGAPPAPREAPARADLLLDASAIRDAFAALRIDWSPDTDVSAQFDIAGSDDLQQWRPLAARATVLHLTQGGNMLDRHEVALDHSRVAYLRLRRLDDGPALPALRVQLRTNAAASATRSARRWLPATAVAGEAAPAEPADAGRPPAFHYRLPAALLVDAVKVELADDNSLARVAVFSLEHNGAAERWASRASFVAFRLRQDGATIGNDDQAVLPARAARDWRIAPATPLAQAPALSVAYVPQRLVFLAQGKAPFRLVAGSATARRGDYPIDAALASLRSGRAQDWQPPLATLGARATLAGDAALAPAPVPRDWKTWLLWGVLVGAALLIAAMALSLVRGGGGSAG